MNRTRGKYLKTLSLHEKVINALNGEVISFSDLKIKPLEIEIQKPKPLKFRIYVYNCGNPPGGRPIDEYKIVLNVGQENGEKGNFDFSKGYFAVVMGYVIQYDVFVIWDATKHENFAFNKNLQVKSESIINALGNKIILQERKTKLGQEKIITIRSKYLIDGLFKRIDLLCDEIVN